MRGTVKGLLVVGLTLGLLSTAQGQRPGQGGLLSNPSVKKELKLTDEQVTKLQDAMSKVQDKHKDDFAKLREMSFADRRKTMQAFTADYNKAAAGVLDDKQMKRFKQIQLQLAGVNALGNPEVQKSLKVSAEQQKKLDTIFEDADKKMRELFQGGNVAGGREKFQQLRKDTEEKANGVLTDEQKKQWKEMQGEPFKFVPQQPGR